jgi:hypothetical protein
LAAFAKLEANFDLYQILSETVWMDLDLDDMQHKELRAQIDSIAKDLGAAGISNRDLAKLEAIQVARAKAVSTLVTALTLNEIRSFNVAEANRNLEGEARQAQRAIRNGFHLQDYVDQYRGHVQQLMEKMGYENKRKPLSASAGLGVSCSHALLTFE